MIIVVVIFFYLYASLDRVKSVPTEHLWFVVGIKKQELKKKIDKERCTLKDVVQIF